MVPDFPGEGEKGDCHLLSPPPPAKLLCLAISSRKAEIPTAADLSANHAGGKLGGKLQEFN